MLRKPNISTVAREIVQEVMDVDVSCWVAVERSQQVWTVVEHVRRTQEVLLAQICLSSRALPSNTRPFVSYRSSNLSRCLCKCRRPMFIQKYKSSNMGPRE